MTAVERRPAAMNPAFAELIKLLAEAAGEEYLADRAEGPVPRVLRLSQAKPDDIDSRVQPKVVLLTRRRS